MKFEKAKNYILTTVTGVLIFLLGTGVGILGMKEYTAAHATDSSKTTSVKTDGLITDKIAIVNLDDGVMVGEEKINYAGKLLTDLTDNFLFTGLEDARAGYATGIYAGYLVIPATFSESVVSLNDTPVRAEITYAINNNLNEESKEEVIYDVLGLVSELNDEISYMYLHSVMDEFHDAQDEANIVMDNDLEEKEAINAIKANDLVALIPVTEITEVENNIVPVDISDYMAKNMELTSEVGIKYNEYLMESEADHQKLNEEAMDLMAEMGNMDGIIGGIDLAHDSDGNFIYQKGAEEMNLLFEEHNAALLNKEAELSENVLTIYKDIQTYLSEYQRARDAYQKENEQKYINTLVALEELFEKYQSSYVVLTTDQMQQLQNTVEVQNEQIAAQQSMLNELQQQSYEIPSESEEELQEGEEYTPEAYTVNINLEGLPEIQAITLPDPEVIELSELQKKMQVVLADNYYVFEGYLLDEQGVVKKDEEGNSIPLTALFDKYNKNLNDEKIKREILEEQVGEIELMDIGEVTRIADEEILMPIQENVDSVTKAIMDQYAIEKEQLGEYSEAVMDYDPLKYIDHEEIQGLTGAMFENGTKLSEAILETDIQQMEYVAEVYEATRNDLANMQDSILKAKEDSDQAVADGLASLQQIKNTNSSENQQIMYDFSEKLPYTRLGSLEYTQAYEFMANPVGTKKLDNTSGKTSGEKTDSVKTESESVNVKENRQRDYQIIGMIICAMICVIIVGSTIKYHFHKKEEEFFEI